MSKPFVCGFCQRDFRNEKTLSAHMCPIKRRHLEKDTVASRMGLELYRRFYELNTNSQTPKTFNDFVTSRYYVSFIKLARHIMDLRPIDQDRFIDYLFTNGIKENLWCRDKTYENYIVDLLEKENPDRALERSIETMAKWAQENGKHFSDFFKEVSTGEATNLIRYGRISPWALYLAETSDSLIERLSPEQDQIISKVVKLKNWTKIFKVKTNQIEYVKQILQEAGL